MFIQTANISSDFKQQKEEATTSSEKNAITKPEY